MNNSTTKHVQIFLDIAWNRHSHADPDHEYEFPEWDFGGQNPRSAEATKKYVEMILAGANGLIHILTLSPIVFDQIRVSKRKDPNGYSVAVFHDGLVSTINDDGRVVGEFPSEFDVHSGLLAQLL